MIRITLVVVASLAIACLHSGASKKDVSIVVTNNGVQPLCNVEFVSTDASNPVVEALQASRQLASGKQLELKIRTGEYRVGATTCGDTFTASSPVAIDGPVAINVNAPGAPNENAPPGYLAIPLPLVKTGGGFEQPSGGGKRHCLPGGDMSTGNASECCNGVILISAKRPNMPSHCAFDDEVDK
jgi:hypothetical protein